MPTTPASIPIPDAGARRRQGADALRRPPVNRHLYNASKTDLVADTRRRRFRCPSPTSTSTNCCSNSAPTATHQLRFPDGVVLRQSASPAFRFRQFYTLPDQPFFCDEPWQAPPGSMNRPGAARVLAPAKPKAAKSRLRGAR
jgi:hypothetical protein